MASGLLAAAFGAALYLGAGTAQAQTFTTVTNTASASGSNLVCANGTAQPCTTKVSNPIPTPSAVPAVSFDAKIIGGTEPVIPTPIVITKTADTRNALAAGDPVHYTITVTNTSTLASAIDVLVSDPVPTGIDPTTYSWQCSGSACTDTDPHTGDLSQTIDSLGTGESVKYAISAKAASGVTGTVTNTASASGPYLVCANGADQPCTARVSNPNPFSTSSAVPTLSEMALILLAALLGVSAVVVYRRGR